MTGVIGIDADRRRLAVVRHFGERKDWFTLERSDGSRVSPAYFEGLSRLMAQASGRAVVFLESIYYRRQSGPRDLDTFQVLAEVQGEIIYEAGRHGVELRRVPPVEWQKRILGVCRVRESIKRASQDEARRMLGSCALTEHEADAACICLYGRWVIQNERGVA